MPVEAAASSSLTDELAGVRAVVTGGTRGIGAATVRRLTAAGARVVAVARTSAPVPEGAHLVTADLAGAHGVTAAAERALALLGGVDVLVNNAGRNTEAPAGPLSATDDDWRDNLDANLMSVVRLDRALVPSMIAQGRGVVVHVSSAAARYPQPHAVPYAAAKAALNAYSKGLAGAVGPHGVRVTAVLPGVIDTEAFRGSLRAAAGHSGRDLAEVRQELLDRLPAPLGRLGTGDEVAELITFLVSPHASYLTGVQVTIDGGLIPTL